MTPIESLGVCVSSALSVPTCHFVHPNRCICRLTVGAYCALFLQTLGGALAVKLRLCVNQAELQTASQAPHGVRSCSSLVSCCHSKFFSSPPLSLRKFLNHHHHLFSYLKSPLYLRHIIYLFIYLSFFWGGGGVGWGKKTMFLFCFTGFRNE